MGLTQKGFIGSLALLNLFGGMAEGLGSALQKRVQRFKSVYHLHFIFSNTRHGFQT
ncbi:MAG: hypothetical protein RJB66_160 [Pseudomonadota bacterium]